MQDCVSTAPARGDRGSDPPEKWTKTPNTFGIAMLMQFLSNVGEDIADNAFRSIAITVHDLDTEVSELNFREASGVKAVMVQVVASDTMLRFAVRLMAIVWTSTRELHCFFGCSKFFKAPRVHGQFAVSLASPFLPWEGPCRHLNLVILTSCDGFPAFY